ncbi:MAG: hypothetical protein IT305_04040, partial [Chloroflexi bacterium]|nr:hypothetical protein [Chloroflexota bacterium]
QAYVDIGAIAFLFGRGAGGATNASDANNDGVTNPAPINGNTRMSLNADDDGGFFGEKAKAYYQTGAMTLPGGSGTQPTPTPTKAPVTPTPTKVPPTPTKAPATPTPTKVPPTPTKAPATPTPAPTTQGYTITSRVSPSTATIGQKVTIATSVTSAAAGKALVDVEIYDPNGNKVGQQFFGNQSFKAGQRRNLAAYWTVPTGSARGTYTVKVGVFSLDWETLYEWEDSAATFTVS